MYEPYNAITGKPYQGSNILKLSIAAQNLGTDDPRWMTFLQAKEKGWKVVKGAKSTAITAVRTFKMTSTTDENTDSEDINIKVSARRYAVFNAVQIEGIPPIEAEKI